MDAQAHWENVYTTRESTSLSWFQATPGRSLELIARSGVPTGARILDVGGGDSTLVDGLIQRGYTNITVLDVSPSALERARNRLGARAATVHWIAADVLTADLAPESVDLWHDRAVFHFLTEARDRDAYIAQVRRVVRPGGYVMMATFAEDGPTRCSGLPVARYSAAELHQVLGDHFRLVTSEREVHRTPGGAEQRFSYCLCRYEPISLTAR